MTSLRRFHRYSILIGCAAPQKDFDHLPRKQQKQLQKWQLQAMMRLYGRMLDVQPLPGKLGADGWFYRLRLDPEYIGIEPPTYEPSRSLDLEEEG